MLRKVVRDSWAFTLMIFFFIMYFSYIYMILGMEVPAIANLDPHFSYIYTTFMNSIGNPNPPDVTMWKNF